MSGSTQTPLVTPRTRDDPAALVEAIRQRHRVALPLDAIGAFCRRHRIRRLSLFGSVLRDDFRPESDLDVLVEFRPGQSPGWDFFAMQEELAGMLGRRVDLNTPGFLGRAFRERVRAEAPALYEADRDG